MEVQDLCRPSWSLSSTQTLMPALLPAPADAAEVADRQAQSGALGLGGNQTPSKKKKKATTTGDKTRLSDKKKSDQPEETGDHPLGNATQNQAPNGTTPAPPAQGVPTTPPQ